ncbi:MAG: WHG domain-containing protein [Candidatus Dormibacteria bacterium]
MRARTEADLSIRAVTKEAGVTPQSFYLQFDNRDQLLYEVYALEYANLERALLEAVDRAGTPGERLLAVCRAYLDFAREQPGRYRGLAGVRGRAEHASWTGRALPGAPTFQVLQHAVAEAIGKRRPGADPVLPTALLWASLHGLVSLLADRPAFPWPPVDQMLTRMVQQVVAAG